MVIAKCSWKWGGALYGLVVKALAFSVSDLTRFPAETTLFNLCKEIKKEDSKGELCFKLHNRHGLISFPIIYIYIYIMS